jgi:hypothetical protein
MFHPFKGTIIDLHTVVPTLEEVIIQVRSLYCGVDGDSILVRCNGSHECHGTLRVDCCVRVINCVYVL